MQNPPRMQISTYTDEQIAMLALFGDAAELVGTQDSPVFYHPSGNFFASVPEITRAHTRVYTCPVVRFRDTLRKIGPDGQVWVLDDDAKLDPC